MLEPAQNLAFLHRVGKLRHRNLSAHRIVLDFDPQRSRPNTRSSQPDLSGASFLAFGGAGIAKTRFTAFVQQL
jgi:hypothetical protein